LLAPVGAEAVFTKSTIGAFATTRLHEVLKGAGVQHLILAGVATSGTVLSTARWAFDVGYRVTICTDACADPDPQAHAALVDEHVFPESWLGLWRIAAVRPTVEIPELQGQ
jgi:nicotinamidase-related amidase